MTLRRLLLVSGALSVLATAPMRVRAASQTEIEGAAYGGTTAGAWACGPVGRANYGGLGARARVSENAAPLGGKGYTGELALAGEYEAPRIIGCREKNGCNMTEPPTVLTGGGHARLGYRWDVVTLEGGLSVFGGFKHNTDDYQTFAAFPDVELGFFTGQPGRALLGIGTPTVTTLRRPGGYLGYDLALNGWDLETRLGVYRAGPALDGEAALRADAAVLFPLTRSLKLRLGGSLSGDKSGDGGEASAGLRGTL